MGELVAIRVRVHSLDADNLVTYFEDAAGLNSSVPGFLGGRLYRRTDDTSDHLILWRYQDVASAERGLVAVSKSKPLSQRQVAGHTPADVERMRVVRSGGGGTDGLPTGPYLSMSRRVADPGFGPDLVEEMSRIFAELQVLPGLRDFIICVNDTLEEQVYGFVTWDTPESFSASLPAGILYAVELFGLVATSSATRIGS